MPGIMVRTVLVAIGLALAMLWVPGLYFDGPVALILAALMLGIVNAVVRPIAILLTLPVTLVTLGFFLLVINAGMVALVAWMMPGMHLAGFSSAFWTALIVSFVGILGSWFVGPKGRVEVFVKRG